MSLDVSPDQAPVNARRSDAFDVFGFRFYQGPNPYLSKGAFVFDFSLSGYREPLPIETYVEAIAHRYPHVLDQSYETHAHLFASTVMEFGKLEMDLHYHLSAVQVKDAVARIAVESIHEPTSHGVVYAVWDWFEAITQDKELYLDEQLKLLQQRFRRSVYGGPTVYALLRTAYAKGIPTFYLPDEGLMQYGYGKHLVRGVATTFDCDSHIDSDFTTLKDDCKAFLHTLGFPVPKGDIVLTEDEAIAAAERIGYPVAVKPVSGHKGIGVTADVRDQEDLIFAFQRAVDAHAEGDSIRVIVEQNVPGIDVRLLCVDGKFVAATQRRPASVIGDGISTIDELIDQENRKSERLDTPTSALGKIIRDDSMKRYLAEQQLSLDSIPERNEEIFLRKVANLSAGGVSVDVTDKIHPDNIILAQDIAQHFRLVCLGIDVLTSDISASWKDGGFGIIEINSAPGIYMHLRPAEGQSVDVTSRILETFFTTPESAHIPVLTLNRISRKDLYELIDHILLQQPNWTIGAICQEAVLINHGEKNFAGSYNTKVQSLLRNPRLDMLITEYPEAVLIKDGMFYDNSNVVVLDNPTDIEMILGRNIFDGATVVVQEGESVSIRKHGLMEYYQSEDHEAFKRVYWKEVLAALQSR